MFLFCRIFCIRRQFFMFLPIVTLKNDLTDTELSSASYVILNDVVKSVCVKAIHDDVIKWKHFPRYWPFVRGIHRSPVNSPHKGQWRGALMFTLICARINGWVNNREAGDLRRYRAHYDVIVMKNTGRVHNSWDILYTAMILIVEAMQFF